MTQIIYGLLGLIDMIVYSLASSLFGLIIDLANVQFFKADQISAVAHRVYIIVGVVMLFKLVISAIQYLVNPDVFDDKEKGLGGILKKTAISIALIVLVPSIFNFLIAIQEPIVKALPDIVLGPGTTDETEQRTIGFNLSFKVLSAFVKVNEDSTSSLPANVGVGEGKEIHDFASLPLHVADGCPGISFFGLGGSMEDCHYDYMVIISTLCGGFLVYVLLTMALDVSIRTIKFGIIQILAPIPISGYVFSKEKLNKFIKTASTVYLDLFIRMIIVYFIIFAIKTVIVENKAIEILNGSGSGMSNLENWFRNVLANVAIIFGLLMFAKNAPKFISELLGLPDVGSGDFKDMFSPGRLTGLAGAAINPARNAVSNYRKAMENNVDMGSKGKRIRNALRRAAGGAGRGGFDAAMGLVNGDDWAKISQRHNKAVATSNRRGAENFMKRTSRVAAEERTREVEQQRKALEAYFANRGVDITNARRSAASLAGDRYNAHVTSLRNDISNLRRELTDGTIPASGDLYEEKMAQLTALETEYNSVISEEGKSNWINKETDKIAASQMVQQAVNEAKAKIITNNRKVDSNVSAINEATAEINAGVDSNGRTLTADEIEQRRARIVQLQSENNKILSENAELQKADTTEGRAEILKQKEALIADYNKRDEAYRHLKEENYELDRDGNINKHKKKEEFTPEISTKTVLRGKVDQFFGGEGFTGKGFIDTADLLKNNRSNLYTGEAMTKMRQNADILVEADGSPATFTSTFATDTSRKYSYADIADLKRKADSGATIDWAKEGFENAAMLQSAFEEVEKKAAEAYVTANMAAADPTVKSEYHLKRGEANSTIVEGIKRMKAQLAAANIPKEERDQLIKELSENPGKFFKGASDRQERMRTRGSRISAYNSGKKDGQS